MSQGVANEDAVTLDIIAIEHDIVDVYTGTINRLNQSLGIVGVTGDAIGLHGQRQSHLEQSQESNTEAGGCFTKMIHGAFP